MGCYFSSQGKLVRLREAHENPLFQVDAFAEKAFEGNPAAVCPLDAWLDDSLFAANRFGKQLIRDCIFRIAR